MFPLFGFPFAIPALRSTEETRHRPFVSPVVYRLGKRPALSLPNRHKPAASPLHCPTCVCITSWRDPAFLYPSLHDVTPLPTLGITPSQPIEKKDQQQQKHKRQREQQSTSSNHLTRQNFPNLLRTSDSDHCKPPKDKPPPFHAAFMRFLVRISALLTTATVVTLTWLAYVRLHSLVPSIPYQYTLQEAYSPPRPLRLSRNGLVVANIAVKNAFAKEAHVGVANTVKWMLGKEKPKIDITVVKPVVFVPLSRIWGSETRIESELKRLGSIACEGPVRQVRVNAGTVVVEGLGIVGGEISGMLSCGGHLNGNCPDCGVSVDLVGKSKRGEGRLRGDISMSGVDMAFSANTISVGTGRASGEVRLSDSGAWGELDIERGAWEGQDIWVESVNGKFRFRGTKVNADGMKAVLGELPLVLFGGFDAGRSWEVAGFVDEGDVESVLETVDVENFLPVHGKVGGSLALKGPWKEPILSGWAETKNTSEKKRCDKLDVDYASLGFSWNINAGVVDFRDIDVALSGGGEVTGSGGIFYDMTKGSPERIRLRHLTNQSLRSTSRTPDNALRLPEAAKRDIPSKLLDVMCCSNGKSDEPPRLFHHPYSPKGRLPTNMEVLPSAPDAVGLNTDPFAMHRPYDSVQFKFQGLRIPSRTIIDAYGGEHIVATSDASLGPVNCDAVMTGPTKGAVVDAVWQMTMDAEAEQPKAEPDGEGYQRPRSGNSLVGSVQLALGDPLTSRRVRIRTSMDTFDLSQLAGRLSTLKEPFFRPAPAFPLGDGKISTGTDITYHSRQFQNEPNGLQLFNKSRGFRVPKTKASSELLFEGRIFQTLVGKQTNPRTPIVELVGAQGSLETRDLLINGLSFPRQMSGRLRFGDEYGFAVHLESEEGGYQFHIEHRLSHSGRGKSSVESATSVDLQLQGRFLDLTKRGTKWSLEAVNFPLGSCFSVANAASSEVLDASVGLDVRARRGGGSLMVRRPKPVPFDSPEESTGSDVKPNSLIPIDFVNLGGTFLWMDNSLTVDNGVVEQQQSEYRIKGSVLRPKNKPVSLVDMACDLEVTMKHVEISEMASSLAKLTRSFVKNGRGYKDAPTPWDSTKSENNPAEITRKSTLSSGTEGGEIQPAGLLSELLRRLTQFMNDESPANAILLGHETQKTTPILSKLKGTVDGSVHVKRSPSKPGGQQPASGIRWKPRQSADPGKRLYQGGESEVASGSFSKRKFGKIANPASRIRQKAVPSAFQMLRDTVVEFDFTGKHCEVGTYAPGHITARGRLSEKTIELEHFQSEGDQECQVSSVIHLEPNERVRGKIEFERVPVLMLGRCTSLPLPTDGNLEGYLHFDGSVSDPKVDMQMEWKHGRLDKRAVHNARTTLICRDGRCEVDARASFGAKAKMKDETRGIHGDKISRRQRVATISRKHLVGEGLGSKSNLRKGGSEEEFLFSSSAPIQFYLDQCLRSHHRLNVFQRAFADAGFSSDVREWISLDVRVNEHGLVLLNSLFPQFRLRTGNSSLALMVRGTASHPLVSGKAVLKKASAWPEILAEPVHAIQGQIDIEDNTVLIRSLGAKYKSNGIRASGELPLFSKSPGSSYGGTKAPTSHGVDFSFGKVGVHLRDKFHGDVHGSVRIAGSANEPTVSGNVVLTKGVIFLTSSDSNLLKVFWPTRLKNLRPQADDTSLAEEATSTSHKKIVTHVGVSSFGNEEVRDPFDDRDNTRELCDELALRNIRLQGLKIALGRDVQIVYPYLLRLGASGALELSGSLESPIANGTVKFHSGSVNLLTRKMKIKHGASNVARFSKNRSLFEPEVSLTVEDRDLRVRLNNATPQTWTEAIHISGKGGEDLGRQNMMTLFQYPLSSVRFGAVPRAISRLLASYLEEACAITAKAGSFAKLKLFPAFVESVKEGEWEHLGCEIEADTKMITLGIKRAFSGRTAVVVGFRPLESMQLDIEADRSIFRARFGIRFGGGGRKINKAGGEQEGLKTLAQGRVRKGGVNERVTSQ